MISASIVDRLVQHIGLYSLTGSVNKADSSPPLNMCVVLYSGDEDKRL